MNSTRLPVVALLGAACSSASYGAALFLDRSTSVAVWGVVTTLALVAAGLAFGTRVFERESG